MRFRNCWGEDSDSALGDRRLSPRDLIKLNMAEIVWSPTKATLYVEQSDFGQNPGWVERQRSQACCIQLGRNPEGGILVGFSLSRLANREFLLPGLNSFLRPVHFIPYFTQLIHSDGFTKTPNFLANMRN